MGSTSFQVRLTDSALNDLHEIDDHGCLHDELAARSKTLSRRFEPRVQARQEGDHPDPSTLRLIHHPETEIKTSLSSLLRTLLA